MAICHLYILLVKYLFMSFFFWYRQIHIYFGRLFMYFMGACITQNFAGAPLLHFPWDTVDMTHKSFDHFLIGSFFLNIEFWEFYVVNTRHLSHMRFANIFPLCLQLVFSPDFSQHKTSGYFKSLCRKVWALLESAEHDHSIGCCSWGQTVDLISTWMPSFRFTIAPSLSPTGLSLQWPQIHVC